MVNELCFDPSTKTVLANIYMSDLVVRIDPRSGKVIEQNVMSSLVLPSERTGKEDVLNGIAALPSGHFLLTGKLYSRFYVLEPKQTRRARGLTEHKETGRGREGSC